MLVICTIAVISGMFLTKADVEGKVLSQSDSKYYVDFSQDLKKRNLELERSTNGVELVSKSDCVEKPK